jgi:hypothetical protein
MPNFYRQWATEEAEVEAEQCDEDTGEHASADEKKSRSWLLRDPPKKANTKAHRIQREHSQAWLLEYDLNAQVGQETDALVCALMLEYHHSPDTATPGSHVRRLTC